MLEETELLEKAVERLIKTMPQKDRTLQMVYSIENVLDEVRELKSSGELADAMFEEVNHRLRVALDLLGKMNLTRAYELKLQVLRQLEEPHVERT